MLHAPGDLLDELTRAHRYRWTHGDEIAALTLEKVDELLIAFTLAWSDKKHRPARPPKPYRYPRPGPKRRKVTSPLPMLRRFFGR